MAELTTRDYGYMTERFWQPYADKFYQDTIIKELLRENSNLEFIKIMRFKHNGTSTISDWDFETIMQITGKDGCFVLRDTVTKEIHCVYFEEKFSSQNYYYNDLKEHKNIRIEIVNNYAYRGWGCGLKEIRFLFFFRPDEIIIMEYPDQLVKCCRSIYNKWVENGCKYEDQQIDVPEAQHQKLELNTYDDPEGNKGNKKTDFWKMEAPMSPWMLKRKCKTYTEVGHGLNKYKE